MNTVKRCDVVISQATGAKHAQVTQSLITVSLTQMKVQRLLQILVHSFENHLTFLEDRRMISGGPLLFGCSVEILEISLAISLTIEIEGFGIRPDRAHCDFNLVHSFSTSENSELHRKPKTKSVSLRSSKQT